MFMYWGVAFWLLCFHPSVADVKVICINQYCWTVIGIRLVSYVSLLRPSQIFVNKCHQSSGTSRIFLFTIILLKIFGWRNFRELCRLLNCLNDLYSKLRLHLTVLGALLISSRAFLLGLLGKVIILKIWPGNWVLITFDMNFNASCTIICLGVFIFICLHM